MYFAFPAAPSSSLSTLTSLMATAEDGEGRRDREVKERDAKTQRQGIRNKEESNSGDKMIAMGEGAKKTTGYRLLKSI